jgi:hypothetical protein
MCSVTKPIRSHKPDDGILLSRHSESFKILHLVAIHHVLVCQFCRTVIKVAGFLEGQALLRSGVADVLLQPAVITGNNMGQYGYTRPVASSW